MKNYLLFFLIIILAGFTIYEFNKFYPLKVIEEYNEIETEEIKERDEYFFNTYKDPFTNDIPANIRQLELDHIKKFVETKALQKINSDIKINWKEAGPFNVGGRTRALVIDIENSNNIIVGGVSGGIWKSTDKGFTWKLKSRKDQILSVTSIVQDTRVGFRNNLFYVGGEYRGNSASKTGAAFYGAGLFKSTDKGETWEEVNTNLTKPTGRSFNSELSYVQKIIIHPQNGYLFLCSNASGILRSTDYGLTWGTSTKKFSLGATNNHAYSDIAVNQNGVLVAAISQTGFTTQENSPGIYKSTDYGDTWINITPSNFPATHARSVIAFVPSNPDWFYILTYTNKTNTSNNTEILSLFRINSVTKDAVDLSNNLPFISSNGNLSTQGNYNMAIAVHPTNPNIVLIGGQNFFRSLDGFTTPLVSSKLNWIGGYNQSYFNPTSLHPDTHTIVFDPNNPNQVWVGHDGGLSFTEDITNINYSNYFPWDNRDYGYAVTQFYTVSQSQLSNDVRLAGGTQDNGTPAFSFDGANSSNSFDATGGDGAYCYFGSSYFIGSTQNGNVTRYGYSSNQIDRNKWSVVTPDSATGQLFINPFTVDPNSENTIYYLAGNNLWRNNDIDIIPNFNSSKTSQGWKRIKNLIPTNYTFTTLAVSKSNPQSTLYLGAYSSSGQPIILKIENALSNNVANDITPNYGGNTQGIVPNGTYPLSIAVNPEDGKEILVIFSNYNVKSIWHTKDGGITWQEIEGNLGGANGPSIRTAAIVPTSKGKIYLAGTTTGLFSTTSSNINGDNTIWTPQGEDVIGNVVIEYLNTRVSDGRILCATHGRGIFIGNVITTNIKNENEIVTDYNLEQNYPNPFNPTTKISFAIPNNEKVTIEIFNSNGEKIKTSLDENKVAGKYQLEFNAEGLSSGIYFYRITANKFSQTKKMILIK
ncbi:MAG: T9SS type A sorting domain-containing protein [Melioribacteraceae bacterium]|nr:T9SS type A sorting domain-containing protein [Melioribacteraceae bacterium]